ncbi:DUF6263 family protein [Chitinophaga ginsengisoli]|uniref:Uncharacterized protein n=1 Tax=Chitinophaga ginsengisoli TaxID=363837 RepID=A0A2P8FVV8_9BACT|nr:DUF6263 family protein [Chitinophaga ginsengisoli]PSL25860.1 hypothetical protein CLV42_11265 [Chitinophaga ginsengisoli]
MTTKSTVLLTGLIFFSSILSAQVKRAIIPVLTPGEQYIFKNTTISDIHDDGVRAINQSFSTSWVLRVVGKTAQGKLMIRATYMKINQRTEHLFTHDLTGFNSDDFKEFVVKSVGDELHTKNDQLRKLGEGMLGKSFTVYINPDWRVDEVTGVDSLINIALDGMEEQNQAVAQSFGKATRGTVNNEEIRKIFDGAFSYVPEEEVAVGDKWYKDDNHHVGPLRAEYIVKSEEANEMEIAVSSATSINNDIQASYSRKGTITVDVKTGLLLRSSVKDDMKPRAGNITRLVVRTVKNEMQKK